MAVNATNVANHSGHSKYPKTNGGTELEMLKPGIFGYLPTFPFHEINSEVMYVTFLYFEMLNWPAAFVAFSEYQRQLL